MQVFDNVVYMDVQKTGSTAITRFLRLNLAYAHWTSDKHARLRRQPEPGEVFLISRRDPVDLWVSLYNYGCDSRGALFKRMTRAGLANDFYTGRAHDFDRWIQYCFEPRNASLLIEDYPKLTHLGLGFQSFRFLVMAVPQPMKLLTGLRHQDQVIETFERATMIHHLIRTSHLNDDLMALAHGPLAPYLRAGALSDDETGQPIRRNASTPHLRAADINPATAALIREREWFLEHVAATWVDRPHAV